MGATLGIGVLFMLATLVVDVLYAVADPRIRAA
jgi:ABC-type dipeptide/oligopeptide/nickel transport system permease component